jgi:hypothetical protein
MASAGMAAALLHRMGNNANARQARLSNSNKSSADQRRHVERFSLINAFSP